MKEMAKKKHGGATMFEKEAEEYYNGQYDAWLEGEDSFALEEEIEQAFQDGAEFGYNKANEWHYVKDIGLPKKDGMYLFYLYDKENTLDYFCEILDISDTDKDPYLETSLWDIEDVIAWKEIVLPELSKESE